MSEDDSPALQAELVIEDERWNTIDGGIEPLAGTCLSALTDARPAGFHTGTLAILFAGDAAVRDLNARFRDKDSATNVLSFPADPEDMAPDGEDAPHLGDIALAYETCSSEAEERGIALKDHAAHLILHGILHVFGYDHIEDADARIMERLETDLLAGMGIDDPHA